ncbi:MAG: hypothetical protein AABY14_02995, partial [Nanoarchaeota archaeon]
QQYKMNPKNTLFGFSTCPDEINRTVTRFSSYYGEKQFHLGGLTGYPFTGKTGFSAFSHHAPENDGNGNLIILYAPHVGINSNGELGKVLRETQRHDSIACGSAISFLNKYSALKNKGERYKPKDDILDTQQNYIEKMFLPYADKILASKEPIKELVDVNYTIIESAVKDITKEIITNFKGKIILIGGVIINTSLHNGYFDLRRFELLDNDYTSDLIGGLKKR